MWLPEWLQRIKLNESGVTSAFDEAVARRRVQGLIADMRLMCEEEGPWAFSRFVEAPEDAEPRQIAYLLVWREGPKLEVWENVQRFDAVDLVVDACAEGFEAYSASQAAQT